MKLSWDWLIPIGLYTMSYLTFDLLPFTSGMFFTLAVIATIIVFLGLETSA